MREFAVRPWHLLYCWAVLNCLALSQFAIAVDRGSAVAAQQRAAVKKPAPSKSRKSGATAGSHATDGPGRGGSVAEPIVFQNEAFVLTRSTITEGDRRATATGGERPALINCNAEMVRPNLQRDYPRIRSQSPLLDVLYRIALADLEMNVIKDEKGTYFRVSPDFPNMIFTRDVAYSSYLGAAYVLPDVVKSHLRLALQLRRKLGFRCPANETIPLPGIRNEPEELSNYEFFEKYGTNSYARRTDDACWVVGYWTALCATAAREELPWLIGEFEYFDRNFYQYFLDPKDGLYFGQASFIDVGGTGYPPGYSIQDSLLVKALSTNCLYAAALDRVAQACALCGQRDSANRYGQRATELKQRIQTQFRHPQGYYAYFKDRQGMLQDRREQLGMSFLVLFDILPYEQHAEAVAGFPHNSFGGPTIYPFYDGAKVYHNKAIWPFADTLYQMAVLRTHPDAATVLRTLGSLSRNALWGNFTEVMDYETGGWQVKHARSYIWSAAAYLSVVFHMLAGIQVEEMQRVHFTPCLPAALTDSLDIEDLHLGGMTLDISLRGDGAQVKRFVVDGRSLEQPLLDCDGKHHVIQIELEAQQPAKK